MKPTKNLIGQKFNRLTVIKLIGQDWNGYNFITFWLCKCDCGKEVIVRGNNLQNKNTKSCGCFKQEKMSKLTGKNNNNYIHGKCCGKYTKAIYKLKEKIYERDNYICQDCGMTQKQSLIKYSRILDIHHIDGDDTNNDLENMVTLCVSCHRKYNDSTIK